METFVPLLLFTLISSYNYTVPMAAKSTDTLSESNDHSESNHPETAHDHPDSEKDNINWTPELKSELIDLWEKADPLRKRHTERLYNMWCQNHKEYSHVKPVVLKLSSERFIRDSREISDERYFARLRILNEKGKFPWTPELKNSLLECNALCVRNRTELKHLWDERHPNLAYLDANFLRKTAYNFQFRSKRDKSVKTNVVWNGERQAKLMDIWDETYFPNEKTKHAKRIFEEWKRRQPDLCDIKPRNLKIRADSLIQQDTFRRIARGERSENLNRRMEYIERNKERVSWTPKMISDLLKCQHMNRYHPKALQRCWQKLQPEYAHLDIQKLRRAAKNFLQDKNRHSQEIKGHGKKPEEHTHEDHGVNANESSRLHQLKANQQTSYAPQFISFQYGYGESSSGTTRLHQFAGNQHSVYAHQFGGSQYEFGESSSRTLSSQQFFMSKNFHHEPQFKGSQHVHGESSSRTPSLHHFNPIDISSYPHDSEGSHQGYSADLGERPTLESTNQDQEFLKHQGRKRHSTHQKESQRSKIQKDKNDLDLDLHLK